MAASRLAQHVVDWLRPVLALKGIGLAAENGLVTVSSESSSVVVVDVGAIVEQPGVEINEGVRLALHALLSTVQDFVSEELRDPWPEAEGAFAMPEVDVDPSGTIAAGYAATGTWVLRMPDYEI